MSHSLEIRRLTYSDLPHVIAIERRAFPTPWSLSMFVLELSKPSGICLAALDRTGGWSGYLVCSRYDTVWHLMNVAVDPARRREGIATADDHLFDTADRPLEQYTLEVRQSNDARDRAVRALRLPRRRAPARLLPRQPRGRPDHVADGAGGARVATA